MSDKSAFLREIMSKELGCLNPITHLPGYSLLTFKTYPYRKMRTVTLFKRNKHTTFSCSFCAYQTFYYVMTNDSRAFPYRQSFFLPLCSFIICTLHFDMMEKVLSTQELQKELQKEIYTTKRQIKIQCISVERTSRQELKKEGKFTGA